MLGTDTILSTEERSQTQAEPSWTLQSRKYVSQYFPLQMVMLHGKVPQHSSASAL